jgi:hypothetical protein
MQRSPVHYLSSEISKTKSVFCSKIGAAQPVARTLRTLLKSRHHAAPECRTANALAAPVEWERNVC